MQHIFNRVPVTLGLLLTLTAQAYGKSYDAQSLIQHSTIGFYEMDENGSYVPQLQNRFHGHEAYLGRHPHFELLLLLKQKGKRAYAMDYADPDFLLWAHGETGELGLGVRNQNWAASIPQKGRGVVFGGSSHFSQQNGLDVQDLVSRRDSGREIFYLVE